MAILGTLLFWTPGLEAQVAQIPPEVVAAHQGPVNVTGDQFTYNSKTDTFVVRGDALLSQAGTVLHAKEIRFERREHKAYAIGNVHLTDREGQILADRAVLDLSRESVHLLNAKVTAHDNSYRIAGKEVDKFLGQRYKVEDGSFTTCGCESGTPSWSIEGSELSAHIGGTGTAKNMKFDILGCPVLYLPRAVFPTDSTRQSGFLSPRMGESGLRGFQYVQPYFFDINRSSDATVALDVESSQRVGLQNEYRLQNGIDDFFWADAGFFDESIRSNSNRFQDLVDQQIADPHIPLDRYDLIAMTRQNLGDNLTAYGDALVVSDPYFLREMDFWTLSRGFGAYGTGDLGETFQSMRDAQSHFGIFDSFEDGYAQLASTWNQDLIQPQQFALQTLPEALVSGRRQLLGSYAYLDYDAQAANFWREQGTDGTRLYLAPSVTVPWRLGDYVYGFVKAGVSETDYDVSGDQIEVIPVGRKYPVSGKVLDYNNQLLLGPLAPGGPMHREIGYVSATARTLLERVYDLNWTSVDKIKHTIVPWVNYTYVPPVDQGQLPLFDEVDRLSRRSLFDYGLRMALDAKLPSGAGALESAEQASATASDESSSSEPTSLTPSIFSSKSFTQGGEIRRLVRFSIEQAYDTDYSVVMRGMSGESDIETHLSLAPTAIASLNYQLDYDPRTHPGIDATSLYLDFQPPWTKNTSPLYMGRALVGSFLQVSYNYIRPRAAIFIGPSANTTSFFMLRAYYELLDRIGIYFAPEYDAATGQLLSWEYGLRLKSPCNCWAIDIGLNQSVNPSETQFAVQVTLGGLGSLGKPAFGANPFQVMGINRTPGIFPGY